MIGRNIESLYWKENKEWWRVNSRGEYELTDKAPERAVESFKKYKRPLLEKANASS